MAQQVPSVKQPLLQVHAQAPALHTWLTPHEPQEITFPHESVPGPHWAVPQLVVPLVMHWHVFATVHVSVAGQVFGQVTICPQPLGTMPHWTPLHGAWFGVHVHWSFTHDSLPVHVLGQAMVFPQLSIAVPHGTPLHAVPLDWHASPPSPF
jgi:hypothetical protein